MSIIMHVDMDAFYASVEMVDRPELRDVPMFVGGHGRSVVLSANYPARAYGVRGGMPVGRARRLCPQAVAIPPDFDRYAAVSKAVEEIFCTVTHRVEMTSIDEAFLDITGSLRRLNADPGQVAEHVRAQIADEQRIPASVGIGPTKCVAKLASTAAKPDGAKLVSMDNVIGFLHPLPVTALCGVGDSTAAVLRRLGLTTVRDIAHTSRYTLQRALGAHKGDLLFDLAWGKDPRQVEVKQQAQRSIGAQETFDVDVDDPTIVATEILRMADRTAARVRAAGLMGQTITLSIRCADFATITRTGTLSAPTNITNQIYAEALRLFHGLHLQRARIRRVGIRMEGLVDASSTYEQPAFDEPEHGWRDAERAIDQAILRFGPGAVKRARLTRRGQ